MNTLKKHPLDTTQRERIHNDWMVKVRSHFERNANIYINSVKVEGDRTVVVDYLLETHHVLAYCWINHEGRVVIDAMVEIV